MDGARAPRPGRQSRRLCPARPGSEESRGALVAIWVGNAVVHAAGQPLRTNFAATALRRCSWVAPLRSNSANMRWVAGAVLMPSTALIFSNRARPSTKEPAFTAFVGGFTGAMDKIYHAPGAGAAVLSRLGSTLLAILAGDACSAFWKRGRLHMALWAPELTTVAGWAAVGPAGRQGPKRATAWGVGNGRCPACPLDGREALSGHGRSGGWPSH